MEEKTPKISTDLLVGKENNERGFHYRTKQQKKKSLPTSSKKARLKMFIASVTN